MRDYRKPITDQLRQTMMIAQDGRCPVPVPLVELTIGQMVDDAVNLKDCVNELCYQCGQYKTAHLGSCDGCRWKTVKGGLR